MNVLAWLRDWAIIAVCPWFAIYLLWKGPILGGVVLAALTALACASRISRQ